MKILVFSAHSADFCSRSGGTIAKHVRKGDEVRVVELTYGERSESGGLYTEGSILSLEEIKGIRHEETSSVASILGAEIQFLNWGDLSFDYSTKQAKQLTEQIRAFCPDVVLTHHGPDPVSVDHDTTWHLVTRAVQIAASSGIESDYPAVLRSPLFLFEATLPLTDLEGFKPDFYIDITDVWEVKLEALKAFHRAQGFLEFWYADLARQRAFQARSLSGYSEIKYAEAFERTRPWVGAHLPLNEL